MARIEAHQLELDVDHTEPAPAAASSATSADHLQRTHRPSPTELLETPDALLTRSDLRELGLERRAVDAVFRTLPIVALPGYSRPLIRARQYLELLEQHTYREDRVRPIARGS